MIYKLPKIEENDNITVVGCGGTGAFVADGLCRLLIGRPNAITLIDMDRVEEHNLGRQAFYECDLGRFKSETLAERLATNYRREVGYSVYPIQQCHHTGRWVIGCVDKPEPRSHLEKYLNNQIWWLDAGNGEYSGQVLIGNSKSGNLKNAFDAQTRICGRLPYPSVQQPALLAPETKPRQARDCAQRVAADEQSPVINQAMAALVLQFVSFLLKGELSWMGAYLDLKAGTLSTVPADPETVSRITGIGMRSLVYHPKPVKEQVRVRV